jgi:hypothetical protein
MDNIAGLSERQVLERVLFSNVTKEQLGVCVVMEQKSAIRI